MGFTRLRLGRQTGSSGVVTRSTVRAIARGRRVVAVSIANTIESSAVLLFRRDRFPRRGRRSARRSLGSRASLRLGIHVQRIPRLQCRALEGRRVSSSTLRRPNRHRPQRRRPWARPHRSISARDQTRETSLGGPWGA